VLALTVAAPARGFAPTDPLAPAQWYLDRIHAFDAWPSPPTGLTAVRVAVVDSGIDGGHPEFAGKIVAARSFVAGSPLTDQQGHGTFVAGEIAAATDNGVGIAGIAPAAQLVVAKIVGPDGTIAPQTEARAIRWVVDEGARVINLSISAVRDPLSSAHDSYSAAEAAAVRFAVAHDALVVAAVGNGDQAPGAPWPYASYPAALPHVLGVSALDQNGNVPTFSDRDAVLNDIAAPGVGIVSTFPRPLTAARPACPEQGYSTCGSDEYRYAEGTSFAAPQVAAAAADLFSIDPSLHADQVSYLLERTASDVNPATGCGGCPVGRDALSGWGDLDIARAIAALLAGQAPPADRYEPNDQAGPQAYPLYGSRRVVQATVDYWDDPTDVYRVYVRRHETLDATLEGTAGTALLLWKPGTTTVAGAGADGRHLAGRSHDAGAVKRLTYLAPDSGWYDVEVQAATPGFTAYTLTLSKQAEQP
jgi:subtilisin family serine protease